MRRLVCGGLLAMTCVVSAPSSAYACTPAMDAGMCPAGEAYGFPANDAVDVPVNTEVQVMRSVASRGVPVSQASTTFRLVTETGEEVPLEASRTSDRRRPVVELRAGTLYVLEDLETTGIGCEPSTTFVEVGRFVTGSSRDDTAPATPSGAMVATCCEHSVCNDGSCCGRWTAATRSARWSVDADTSLVAYRVGGGTVFGSAFATVGWADTGMFGFRAANPTLAAGWVEARAIDGAGNASEWAAPVLVRECDRSAMPPEPGWSSRWEASCTGPADAGPVAMDASMMPAPRPGCATAPRARGGAESVVTGLVAIAILVRRRTHAASVSLAPLERRDESQACRRRAR